MIRKLLPLVMGASLLAAFSASAQTTLYSRFNTRTGTANGFNGADTSSIAANSSTFGFGVNGAGATQALADRFILSSASFISGISFVAYSTGTYPFPPTSPFTAATMNIWNGVPGAAGSSILFTSSTLSMTAWTGIYRVTSTTLTNAQRPIFSLTMGFNNVQLAAGTYYASWAVTGVTAPGSTASVFSPMVMNTDGTMPMGTALQSTNGGTSWANLIDTTAGYQISVPLAVTGTVVPEPSSVALMLLGGGGLAFGAIRARRRRL
jgi:hypothetical protein